MVSSSPGARGVTSMSRGPWHGNVSFPGSCGAERPGGRRPLRSGMSPERSHRQVELGHQLYPVLEQCRKPEVLWAKLATGNYDWLGVRRNGKYVLGRPRLATVLPEDPGPAPDDRRDPHRVESLAPLQ